jgi:hypothetical protein
MITIKDATANPVKEGVRQPCSPRTIKIAENAIIIDYRPRIGVI